jgi:membrane fusion protein (multidrug efflux system)
LDADRQRRLDRLNDRAQYHLPFTHKDKSIMKLHVLLIVGSTLLIFACRKGDPPRPPPPTVQVSEVVQQDVPIYREWVGTLNGFVNAEIRPQVTGYIQKQAYKEGGFVHEGEPLYLIDPRNYKDLSNQARHTLDRNVAAFENARINFERDKKLIAAGVISRQQYDNDAAALRQAAESVETSRAALKQAELYHSWTQVVSPIAGIAGITQVQVGDLANTSTMMTTVSQVDPIKAQFNISEVEYLRSIQGNHWAEAGESSERNLELILADGSVYPHRGVVIVVNRQVDQRTGTIAIQCLFPNPGNALRPGQYARVRTAVITQKNALLVPQRAVNEVQGAYQVAVVGSDGKVDFRTIKTGEQIGTMWIVESGVSAGDKAIVSGLARLKPGMPVHAVPASHGATAAAASSSDGKTSGGH